MSAVPPIATESIAMQRTTRRAKRRPEQMQQPVRLFNHLVGTGEQHRRDFEAEHPRDLQIDDKLELGSPRDWQVGRLFALQDPPGVNTDLAKQVRNIRSVTH